MLSVGEKHNLGQQTENKYTIAKGKLIAEASKTMTPAILSQDTNMQYLTS